MSSSPGVVSLGCTGNRRGCYKNHWALGPTSSDSGLIVQRHGPASGFPWWFPCAARAENRCSSQRSSPTWHDPNQAYFPPVFFISADGNSILPVAQVKTLGVILDSFSLISYLPTNPVVLPSAFIQNPLTSSPFYSYYHIQSSVISCLDYHDSLLTGPLFLTLIPESILHMAARTILIQI